MHPVIFRSSVTLFFSCLLISLVLTPLVRYLANKYGIVDKPKEYRKIHTRVIPRLGGVAVYVSLLIPLLVSYWMESGVADLISEDKRHFWGLFIAATLVWGVGIWDDIRGVRPSGKVLFVAVASIIAFYSGFRFGAINTPFGEIRFGLMSLPVTMVWLIGTSNAINLIDGMDGLASGVSLVSAATIFVLSVISGNILIASLAAAYAGAVLGFLVYNFPPASIFLGDSGSLLLGFLLGSTVLLSSFRHVAVGFAIPLIIFALPIADTVLAILRRWAKRMPISSADRDHIHHRLLSTGLSQKQAVAILYGSAVFLGLIAILTSLINASYQIAVFILLIAAFVIIIRLMNWTELKLVSTRIHEDVTRTRTKTEHWSLVNKICNEIKYVKSEYRLKELLQSLFEGIELDRVEILTNIPSTIQIGKLFSFSYAKKIPAGIGNFENVWSVHLQIMGQDDQIGHFFAVKDVGSSPLPSDIALQIEAVMEALSRRLKPRSVISAYESDPGRNTDDSGGVPVVLIDMNGPETDLIYSFIKAEKQRVKVAAPGQATEAIQKETCRLIIINAVIFDHELEIFVDRIFSISPHLNLAILIDSITTEQEELLLKSGCISVIRKPLDLQYIRQLVNYFIPS